MPGLHEGCAEVDVDEDAGRVDAVEEELSRVLDDEELVLLDITDSEELMLFDLVDDDLVRLDEDDDTAIWRRSWSIVSSKATLCMSPISPTGRSSKGGTSLAPNPTEPSESASRAIAADCVTTTDW